MIHITKKIDISKAFISETNDNAKEMDWKTISNQVGSYVLLPVPPPLRLNKFPGLSFSNEIIAPKYFKFVWSLFDDQFSKPRGNLTRFLKFVVVGVRPGQYHKNDTKSLTEPYWYNGPSSNILLQILDELKIYPYFTNFYASSSTNESFFHKEIDFLEEQSCYDSIHIIFLGKSNELSNFIFPKKWKTHTVYHPSHIIRKPAAYESWRKQFQEIIEFTN